MARTFTANNKTIWHTPRFYGTRSNVRRLPCKRAGYDSFHLQADYLKRGSEFKVAWDLYVDKRNRKTGVGYKSLYRPVRFIRTYNETAKVTELRSMYHGSSELPAYAWPGGYPLFYLVQDTNPYDRSLYVYCPKCANRANPRENRILDYDVNYEDPNLYCDNCSKRIESAYAEELGVIAELD